MKISYRKQLLSFVFIQLLGISFAYSQSAVENVEQPEMDPATASFISLLINTESDTRQQLNYIETSWQSGYIPMAVEILSLARRPDVVVPLMEMLAKHTGENYRRDTNKWFKWIWNQPENRYPHYADFKSSLYGLIDQKFRNYFEDGRDSTIRLDEIRWGGVRQDGIPPLRSPAMISAKQATYLDENDIVFGVKINGDTRAYPKRILAWHEMFVDKIGGVDYAGVYCTLCGAVILYETVHQGVHHQLGTSGFLFRSNKLMYDKATQSLWNTTWGRPVVGPLVGKDIELQRSYVVTTTWGEWLRRHPDTTVLSLQTGHRRNYDEGVAYRDYFATDELMFDVPIQDTRLKNKDEILALTFPEQTNETLAIHAEYLNDHPVYHDQLGDTKFVVLTDATGANRVYETGEYTLVDFDGDRRATDANGLVWQLKEDALSNSEGVTLRRLPAHRAFWFGWYASNNDTRLVL